MELGQRLKTARLEAGLSQRQLCGDTITRNMLSLIENGSAQPSMDTLRILAARLGKPVGYFMDDQAALSPNAAVMARARAAGPEAVLDILAAYRSPDKDFDGERYLLEALTCLELAAQALADGKPGLAGHYLTRARDAGEQTCYYTQDLERRRLLLLGAAGAEDAAVVVGLLPDNDREMLLRAEAAYGQGQFAEAQALLNCVIGNSHQRHYLQAQIYFAQGRFEQAAEYFGLCDPSRKIYQKLECCYKELKDFEKAYYYACKQRDGI